ncbi:MAG TPA: LLM class flavin-dependent oxidoreductase [Euzebyales bacterium]|nr:LLM class flavin-dependent oxidoreductase [Euzebyales bacterium]
MPFPTDGADAETHVAQLEHMLATIADSYDSVWFDDHLLPWADFVPTDAPALECLTSIAYLAGRHTETAFGSLVLCQSFRNPALVAKMAATLHALTGGRFILGMGAGWMESEYRAYGYDFPRAAVRIAQLAEAVLVIRAAWSDGPVSFAGEHNAVDGVVCRPLPVPHPPIMLGGGGERLTLRVVAEHADWWNITGTPETYRHKLDVLRGHCADVGRDIDEITLTYTAEVVAVARTEAAAHEIAAASPFTDVHPCVGTPEQVAEALRPFVDLGVEHLMLRFVDFPSTGGAELFASEVVPLLR